MRANGELTENEFRTRKQKLLLDKDRLKELLNDTDQRVDNWLDIVERGFDFAEKASQLFEKAKKDNDIEAKKEIFSTLGSDLILKDKKLFISWDNLLLPIKSMASEVDTIKSKVRTSKKPYSSVQMHDLYSKSTRLLALLDDV
jgi:hypothetical protein